MNTFICISLFILVLCNVIPLALQFLSKPPLKPLNFENDIVFLNYLINSSINDYNEYVVKPAKASGRALMTDEDLNKFREEVIIEIFSHLSLNYKRTLLKYFNEEGIRYYIANSVNNEITNKILKYNSAFFNKTSSNKSEDITNVRKTDL